MKSYTDIEQSKKLAEILLIESADMDYIPVININGEYSITVNTWDNNHVIEEGWIPCWSLVALFRVLPKYIDGSRLRMDISKSDFNLWFENLSSGTADETLPDITKENPVDACCEMIIKLHEQKLL